MRRFLMKVNKKLIIGILLLLVLTIGAVSASEDISDDSMAAEPSDDMLTDHIDNNLATDSQDEDLRADEPLSLKDLNETLTSAKPLSDESNLIEINLTNNYKYNPDKDDDVSRIVLNGEYYRFKTIVLDGKGYTIDGGGKDLIMRLGFMYTNVTVKNIIFKNFNRTTEFSSGYRDFLNIDADKGRLENCTFENITSTTNSYTVYLQGGILDDNNYAINDCTFTDNDVKCLMYFNRNNVQVNNCSFSSNKAVYFMGDYYSPYTIMNNFQINGCNFTSNSAEWEFIKFYANNTQINNCNFKNNHGCGFGYVTQLCGNNSKMSNCTFEDNFATSYSDVYHLPITWFGEWTYPDREPSGENISVFNVTFKNNVAIPIRWQALSGNVTDCVFINNNGTIENQGNVYRDNGVYDFEVKVYNDTIIGAPDNSLYPVGPGPIGPVGPVIPQSENLLVEVENFGSKSGRIVLILNGVETYNKEMDLNPLSITLDDLSFATAGDLALVIKFISDEELVLYDDNVHIDYYLGIDDFYNVNPVSPHSILILNITIPKDADGLLVFNDGIKNSTLEYADGKATYILDASIYDELDLHTISIILVGDSKYPNKSQEYPIFIRPKFDTPQFVSEGETPYIFYDVPDDFVGEIKVYNLTEDGEKDQLIVSEVLNGSSKIPIPVSLEEGVTYYSFEVSGLEEDEFDIKCIKNQEEFDSSIESNEILVGEDTVVTISSDLDNAAAYFLVDSNTPNQSHYEQLVLNGTPLIYNISDLTLGEHIIKVYMFNPIDLSTLLYTNSFAVNVVESPAPTKKATKIICEDMVTTAVSPFDPKTGEYFQWKLVDEKGNPVKNAPMQIEVNGVIYTYEKDGIQTDENGIARLQINLGYAGVYTFKMYFLGDDNYNASSAVAKITVKPQTPQLVAASRSYVATSKTKKLTATFKTAKGTAIANKWITFTLNGKAYKTKTNANGLATVNIILNKKGTYKFVAKFAGDSTYAPISKTAKLTIK